MQIREVPQQFIRLADMPEMELRSTFRSTQGYKAHSHRTFSIGLLHSGMTRLTIDGKPQQVEQGDLVIIEPDRVHACNPVAGISRGYHMLYIDSRWCLDWLSGFYGADVTGIRCDAVIVKDTAARATFMALVAALTACDRRLSQIRLEQLAPQLLLPYCSPQLDALPLDSRAVELKQQLLNRLTEPESLADIARQVGLTPEALIRLFKRSYGITPRAFINNARIEHARELLRKGMALVDVAQSCGFADQSQFHRTFVNYTAATPGQYQSRSISDNT